MFEDLEDEYGQFISTMSGYAEHRMRKLMLRYSKKWPNHTLHFWDAMGSVDMEISRPGRTHERRDELVLSDYGRHERDDRPTDYHKRLRPLMEELISAYHDYLEFADLCRICINSIKVHSGEDVD